MKDRFMMTPAFCRIFTIFFCIAILLAELNILNIFEFQRNIGNIQVSSEDNRFHDGTHSDSTDVIATVPGFLREAVFDEAVGYPLNRLSFRGISLRYIMIKSFFLMIPLVSWSLRTTFLQSGYGIRRFLMQYIHNSDGEKGEAAFYGI